MKQRNLVKFLCDRVYFWAIFYATGYRVLSGLPHTPVTSLVKYPPPGPLQELKIFFQHILALMLRREFITMNPLFKAISKFCNANQLFSSECMFVNYNFIKGKCHINLALIRLF